MTKTVTYYGYDSLGRPTTIVAPDPDDSGPLSAPTTYLTYDARGLVGVTDPLSRTTTFALDKAGRRIAVTDTANETTNYVYNFYDQVMSIASPDPDGVGPQARSIQTYEYDQNGRLSRSMDPKQKSTQYSYDFANNLRTITDPTSQTTTFDYDGLNRKIRETKTVATYAPNAAPQSADREFVYDVAGNLVQTVDRNGRLTQFLYDKLDRVVEEKWLTSTQISTSVSTLADGLKQDESQVVGWNATTATNLSGTFRLTYNSSQTAPIAWNADAATIRSALESLNGIGVGNVDVSVTAPTAFSRSITVNFKNSLAGQNASQLLINVNSLVATGGGVSAFQQTTINGATIAEKQRLFVTSTSGSSLAGVWYLGFGSEVSPPLSPTASFATVRDTLNAFAGIDSVTVSGSFPMFDVTFGGTQSSTNMQEIRIDATNVYDNFPTNLARTITSNYNAEDELLSISDPSATINYTRDALGRATSIQNVLGTYAQTNFTFHQSFDAASNRTSLRAVHGTSNDFLNTYNYDKLDRLIEVTQSGQAGGASVLPKRVSIAYNALGQRTQIDRFESTGVSHPVAATSYSYDFANRLSRIEHKKGATVFNAHDYLFDRMSRISSVTSVDGTVDYTYDPLSQLLSADDGTSPLQATSQSFDFTYDDNGNRTNSGYTTPVDDRVQTAPGSETYRYDLEGNIIQVYGNNATARTLTWDHRNRLTRAVVYSGSGNITVDYEYDAFNRLVKRTQSGTSNATYFAYDEGINPHLQFESYTGQISHRYLWSDQVDELFADEQKLAGTGYDTFWTLGDHQGTLKDILDYNPSTGTTSVVNHRRYDAFGNLKSQSGAVVVQFGYTGKFFDATTGFQNSWNRWYSPRIGRFLSQDPIGFDGGDTNLYRYVGNGVTNAIDPSGLQERSSWDIESELISIYNQPVRSEADIAKFTSLVTQLLRQRELESIRQRERDNQTVMRSATSSEIRDLLDVEMRTIWNRMYIGIATDAEKNRWHQVRRENSPGLALANDLVGPEGGVWRSIEIAGMMAGGGPVLQNATGASTPKLTTAPVSGGKTVLGHYPAYTELAEQLGARRFNIPTSVWNKMTEVERWEANTKFLDRMIARGDDIILATRADLAKPGSYFARELEFLLSKGFKISADGLRLIAPGAR